MLNTLISTSDNMTDVDLAAPKFWKLCQGFFGFIGGALHAQGDKYLVGVEAGVFASMYWVFRVWMGSIADGAIRCILWGMSPRTLMAFNRRAAEAPNRLLVLPVTMVPSFNSMSRGRAAGYLGPLQTGRNHRAHGGVNFCLIHQKVDFVDFVGSPFFLGQTVEGMVVACG